MTKVKEDTHLKRLIEKTENIFTKNIERYEECISNKKWSQKRNKYLFF